MKISILIPVYNEEENLPLLYDELCAVATDADLDLEMIFVDDGSTDTSWEVVRRLADNDQRCVAIRFRRNFGQTAGLAAAIDHSTGDVLIPMDADLQNDPADIPRLLAALEEGYDVVSGWRKDRQDRLLSRRLPSVIANRLIARMTGVPIHDLGCSLKAYRREVLSGLRLYGDMHRFIAIYASWTGASVTELVVNHRSRRFGESKYGINRTFKVLMDMVTLKFLGGYTTRPIHFFGGLGAGLMAVAFAAVTAVVIEKIVWDTFVHKMSVLLLSSFLATASLLLVMMGLLAELIIRTWHESQDKPIYVSREVLNAPWVPADGTPRANDAVRSVAETRATSASE